MKPISQTNFYYKVKTILTVSGLILLLALQSCTNTRVYTTVKSQGITPNSILTQPKIAYLSVDAKKKINGKSYVRAKMTQCPSIDEMKHQAEYDALKSNYADVLVEPIFKVTVTDKGKIREITAEVSGYSGIYTDFKDFNSLSKEEVESLKQYAEVSKNPGIEPVIKNTSSQENANSPLNLLKKKKQ